MTAELDIVIPVYNEGRQIVAVLAGLARAVKTPARVLICYDREEDDTLPALRANPQAYAGLPVELVRNAGRGVHGAVMTGFATSTAPFILMFPADDHSNAPMVDRSIELLVKAHRLNWKIAEVPVTWIERQDGRTRFQVLRWLPAYLRWYFYAFATTFLRRPPSTVAMKETR